MVLGGSSSINAMVYIRGQHTDFTTGRRSSESSAAARGEVILCAGAVMSPVLLQLSGVGDPALSIRHGVPVVHDLDRVGKNCRTISASTTSTARGCRR